MPTSKETSNNKYTIFVMLWEINALYHKYLTSLLEIMKILITYIN